MKMEMICAGFGGQGVLTIGKFLAQAGMVEGKKVSWLPSYGPEMRGGTANVSVVLSDEDIASPLVTQPDILVALNQPSLDKFGPSVRTKGIVFINTDMCPHKLKRDDLEYVYAPMSKIAAEIGTQKVINMIAIGMIIGKTKVVSYKTIEEQLIEAFKLKNPEILDLNIEAVKKGMEI